MSIALKEAYETHYWLRLMHCTDYISTNQFNSLETDVLELIRILMAICKTSSNNR